MTHLLANATVHPVGDSLPVAQTLAASTFIGGSLVPGKRADFLILSEDPLQAPAAAIKDVRMP